ncbi:MAG: DNA-processing protein DprA [Rickettsiales bacterium]
MSLATLRELSRIAQSDTRDHLIDTIRLIRSENVGSMTFFALVKRFGLPSRALEAIPDMAARGGRKKPIVLFSRDEAVRELDQTEAYGARFISYLDPDYPEALLHIPDPPPIIATLGHPHLWQKPCIAMVGARNASANGCHFAKKLAHDLGEAGYVIVSGLARGIDTFAHQGALASGTVAAIASGIDHIYPPENAGLYQQLREMGAIVSENPFGAIPHSRAFPARNRIISGLSLGTVVVEAAQKSGSLITAKFALEQNREVFAVPGSPMDPRAKGCNELLKQGATLVESIDDVLKELRKPSIGAFKQQQLDLFSVQEISDPTPAELDSARTIIDEKLGFSPIAIDELITQTHISANVLLTILLEKELAGVLQRHPGGRVSLVSR